MEKLSQLAYHPLKMQSCYEKMEPLRLDGLQQRFDVSSTSVFKQRVQIHMREVSPGSTPSLRHTCSPPSMGPVMASGQAFSPLLHILFCLLGQACLCRAPVPVHTRVTAYFGKFFLDPKLLPVFSVLSRQGAQHRARPVVHLVTM
jgi:hypothetical protein